MEVDVPGTAGAGAHVRCEGKPPFTETDKSGIGSLWFGWSRTGRSSQLGSYVETKFQNRRVRNSQFPREHAPQLRGNMTLGSRKCYFDSREQMLDDFLTF